MYDLGSNTINVSNVPSGSGNANLVIDIPYSLFPADHSQYVYVWTNWTNISGGGFIEVAYDKGLLAVGPSTPEARTVWGGLLMGALLLGGVVKRRFQKPTLAA